MPEKSESNYIMPLIGEFIVRFSALVSTMEMFLGDVIDRYWSGLETGAAGENFQKIIKIYQREMLLIINTSPWVTKRQKAKARTELKSLIKDLKIASYYRNIVAHGHWYMWEKDYPYVSKSSKPANHENLKIPEELLRECIKVTDELDKEVWDMWHKYQYGEGVTTSKILFNRYQKRINKIEKEKNDIENLRNITGKISWHLNRVGIHTLAELIETTPTVAYKKIVDDGLRKNKRLLYSLMGAVENKYWWQIAREQRK